MSQAVQRERDSEWVKCVECKKMMPQKGAWLDNDGHLHELCAEKRKQRKHPTRPFRVEFS